MRNPFRSRQVVDDGLVGDDLGDDREGPTDPEDRYGELPEAAARIAARLATTGETPVVDRDRGKGGRASSIPIPSGSIGSVPAPARPRAPEKDRDEGPTPKIDDRVEAVPDPDQDELDEDEPAPVEAEPAEVPADEFSDQMERIRSDAFVEQRSAWAYLGVLGGLFCFVLIFGYGCSERRSTEVATGDAAQSLASSQPSQLVFRVDDDIITLQGAVPDEAAKSQLVSMAQDGYGQENVIDELSVDEATTFEGGTIRFVGSAPFGDERALTLQEAVIDDFGLANRGFEVGAIETERSPVNAEVAVADGQVRLIGALPDDQSLADLVTMSAEVWGAENVDASGLTVGETTWTDGQIRITGTAVSTDDRIGVFSGLVPGRIGNLVTVDTTGLSIADNSQLLAEVQATVDELVAASPIQFAPNSPDIDPASDQVLIDIAAALAELPDVSLEVVGHTDSVGDDQENLVLSEDRALAVVGRLTELGVAAERMSSRGEGETRPIADNTTDEGKAANRRIEFVLVGTSEIE